MDGKRQKFQLRRQRHNRQRILVFCLIFSLVLSNLNFGSMLTYATEGNRRTFEIGSDVKAVLKDGVLTVKGYGDTRDFSCDTAPFAEYADEIRTLVIEDGITYIGSCLFYGLGGLQGELILPESIVGIGDYLTELLNQKGIETIHDKGVYDIINGQLDRSNAYEYAEAGVRPILEANPTIEVAIDLHRDGVAEGTHLVTEVNGKPTAKIMYFNGLSRTRANGDITYLPNPYIQDNLAFSLQMELASERMFPGFARHIYLRAYRYNLHLLPKSLLIEAGAQTNTVQEMKNAMEVLAETLCQVIG